MTWIEGGFCCFPFLIADPKEDGGREAKIQLAAETRR
jgi:hypothetical protein